MKNRSRLNVVYMHVVSHKMMIGKFNKRSNANVKTSQLKKVCKGNVGYKTRLK